MVVPRATSSSIAPNARVMLAVLQGFVLQQAWEPDLDIDAYVAVVDSLIDGMVER